MELTLLRIGLSPECTMGRLFDNGGGRDAFGCDTLEPPDRGLTSDMTEGRIRRLKVAGQTAIPTGRYRLLVTKSPRFQQWLPLLVGVKGFEGIRIHAGNTVRDTAGCILVGVASHCHDGVLDKSRLTLRQLMEAVKAAERRDEQIWLTVKAA